MKYIKLFNENTNNDNTRITSCLVELLDMGFNITYIGNIENKINVSLSKNETFPLGITNKDVGVYPGNIHKHLSFDTTLKTKPANRINTKQEFTSKENELIELTDDATNKLLHTFNYKLGSFVISPRYSNITNPVTFELTNIGLGIYIEITIIN